jgi:hypothetical protein
LKTIYFEYLGKGYKQIEVANIIGLHPNTISKINRIRLEKIHKNACCTIISSKVFLCARWFLILIEPAPLRVQKVLKLEDIPKFFPTMRSKNITRAINKPETDQCQVSKMAFI